VTKMSGDRLWNFETVTFPRYSLLFVVVFLVLSFRIAVDVDSIRMIYVDFSCAMYTAVFTTVT